ncbi:bifunctional metallophosphatase/5'-nucleotidase [Paradesulfitobacterium ferrireducens]|uniref:bifunctional metallophosphatase/5'-nucleotidase n=1 Tax=Paradesulfitobacterium ferrireducens TaxID=2816476 RepID=UPI001A8D551A|nr:bifunctional metallophosphatase/5'-nucleotidase [Paradesulfitobacterium ferrireducens]
MGNRRLTIIQINDVHGYLDLHQELFWQGRQAIFRLAGGYARLAALVKQIRAENPNVLFCDNGDTFHGTYPVVQTKGEILVPLLNNLGLDAMTVHWEFAYSPEVLKERAAELNYPLLAANIYHQENGQYFLQPYIVKNINGLKIGIIGLASNIVDKTMPASYSKGLTFTNGRDQLPGLVEHLRSHEHVDLVVLLSHLGFPQDVKLVSEVQGINICLSGHTHNRLYQPVLQGSTIIVQSGYHGSFLTTLEIKVDGQKIVNFRHQLHEVTPEIQPDPVMAKMVETALKPFQEELSQVVGATSSPLHRGTSLESTMDNFLLQSLLETTGAQIAFSNGWRYGTPIIPGPISLNDLYNIIPMNPPVSVVSLTGEEIVCMLEENLERTFSPDPFQQMGGYVKRCLGLTAYIRIENPNGKRIQKLFIGQDEVKLDRIYKATFVTEQGVPLKYGTNRQNIALKSIDAMQMYLARHRPLSVELQGTFVPV